MEYIVLIKKSSSLDSAIRDLKIEIKEYMNVGYKLQGGISITAIGQSQFASNEAYYYLASQAIVK